MHRPQFNIFNYNIKNQSDNTIDIHVDGDIVDSATEEFLRNWFGDETSTSFKSLRNKIEEANPKTINLYVNSVGGHVGDAMAIHDYLKEKESKGVTVNRRGRGIVASAATYLVMGNNSELSENSFFGIHNVHSAAWGDIVQMENQVKNARKFNDRIVEFYSNSTGKSKEDVTKWMNEETWFTAQEAKENGFVSNITGEVQFKNKIAPEKWEYKNQEVLRIYNSFTNINPINMDIKKLTETVENGFKNLMEKMGLKEKQDDPEVQNAFKEFSDSIVNAVKEGQLSEDKVKEIVKNSFTEILNEKKFVTEEVINDKTKDFVNKTELTKALEDNTEEITKEISKSLGNKTEAPDGEDLKETKNKKKATARNRYAGVTEEEFGVK